MIIIPNGYGSSKVLDLYADLMCTYFNVPVNRKKNDSSEDVSSETDSSVRTANIPDISTQSD